MTLEDMLYVMQPKEDFLRSMDYLYDVKQFYEPLCSEFHLEYREIKEWKCIVLIGDGFVLEIADARFDGVGVFYWYKENGRAKRYSCRNYLVLASDDEERKHLIGGEQTLDVCIRDGFIITAFCLRNKWSNILRGDKSWIEKAKGSVWFAELPLTNPPSDYMISLIKQEKHTDGE